MNRRQKRRKRFAAREHQEAIKGQPVRVQYPDGTMIDTVRGRKPRDGYHVDQPPVHGQRLDARGMVDQTLRGLFGPDFEPTPELRHEFRRLTRAYGSADQAGQALRQFVQQRTGKDITKPPKRHLIRHTTARSAQLDRAMHGFSAVDGDTGERVDPAAIKSGMQVEPITREGLRSTVLGCPTEAEWDEITATAKRRKRGVARVAEKAGYALEEGADPKDRLSWVRS